MLDTFETKKVIGIKQSTKHIKNGEGTILYIAKDADYQLVNPLKELANDRNIDIIQIETMKELGRISGVDVKAAATLIIE